MITDTLLIIDIMKSESEAVYKIKKFREERNQKCSDLKRPVKNNIAR